MTTAEMEKVFSYLVMFGVMFSVWCCPPEEDIAPYCACKNIFGEVMMTCTGVLNTDQLVAPMRYMAINKRKIYSLLIENSTLQYIPHNIFKGTGLEKIRFVNTQLMSLSESDVAFAGIEDSFTELRATDAHYVTQWQWSSLRNLKNIELIDVNWISLGTVEEPFPELPKLIALGIIKAELSVIVETAFAQLKKLTILNMKSNDISTLKRNMLPNPAEELAILDLSDNDLSSLPVNMFTEMPKLTSVHLDKNKFITFDQDTFQLILPRIEDLTMTENPFRCDCRMRWLPGKTHKYGFKASCSAPEHLVGVQLKDLSMSVLWC